MCWYIGSELIKGIVGSVWIYTTRLYPSARDSIVSTGSEFIGDKGTGDQISENVKMVKIVQNRPHVKRFLTDSAWSTELIGKVIKTCKQVNMTMWVHIVSGENTGLFASLLGMVQKSRTCKAHAWRPHADVWARTAHGSILCKDLISSSIDQFQDNGCPCCFYHDRFQQVRVMWLSNHPTWNKWNKKW